MVNKKNRSSLHVKKDKSSPDTGKSDTVKRHINLQIVSPENLFAVNGGSLDVRVNVLCGKEYCDYEQLPPEFKETKCVIKIGDKDVATLKADDGTKAAFCGKINLKYTHEGSHSIVAYTLSDKPSDLIEISQSAPVIFVVDRTPPLINFVSDVNLILNSKDCTRNIIIEADDVHSGLDLSKCFASINNKLIKNPFKQGKTLLFPLQIELAEGSYEIKFIIADKAGNESKASMGCIVDCTPPEIVSVVPSNVVKVSGNSLSNITVEAVDKCSGLDVKTCSIDIDGKVAGKPRSCNKGVDFVLNREVNEGVHVMVVNLYDLAGNMAKHETKLIIDKTPPVIKSILPLHESTVKKDDLSSIVISACDGVSGIDISKCKVSIDDSYLKLRGNDGDRFSFELGTALDEGKHIIRVVLSDNAGNIAEHECEFSVEAFAEQEDVDAGKDVLEDTNDETVQETMGKDAKIVEPLAAPVISSIFPGNEICVNSADFCSVVVEIDGSLQHLDTSRCEVTLSGQTISNPAVENDLLLFQIKNVVSNGSHKVRAVVFDIDGNKVETSSEFHVLGLTENSETRENDSKSADVTRCDLVIEKLTRDEEFIKRLLNDPSGALGDECLDYTYGMLQYLPPELSAKQASFIVGNDTDNMDKRRETVAVRVAEALSKESTVGMKREDEKALTDKGEFTEYVRETFCSILQDPVNAMKNIGVTLTDEEKETLFSPFSRKEAEKLIDWIALVQKET